LNTEIFCDSRRIRVLKIVERHFSIKGPVVYWMQRDQRAFDNWALLYAQLLALKNNVGLIVVFNIVPSFLNAPLRHYDFMLQGLFQTRAFLEESNVPLVFTFGEPAREIYKLIKRYLQEFLTSFSTAKKMPAANLEFGKLSDLNKFEEILKKLDVDRSVAPVNWLKPGFIDRIFPLIYTLGKLLHNV